MKNLKANFTHRYKFEIKTLMLASCFIFSGAFASSLLKKQATRLSDESRVYCKKLKLFRGAVNSGSFSEKEILNQLDTYKTFLRATSDRIKQEEPRD